MKFYSLCLCISAPSPDSIRQWNAIQTDGHVSEYISVSLSGQAMYSSDHELTMRHFQTMAMNGLNDDEFHDMYWKCQKQEDHNGAVPQYLFNRRYELGVHLFQNWLRHFVSQK